MKVLHSDFFINACVCATSLPLRNLLSTGPPPFFSINHSRLYTLQAYIRIKSFYFATHQTVAHPHNHTMIVLYQPDNAVYSLFSHVMTNIYKYRVHQICAFWWPGFEYLDSSSPSTFFRCSATLLCTGGRFIMVWRILKNKRYLSFIFEYFLPFSKGKMSILSFRINGSDLSKWSKYLILPW